MGVTPSHQLGCVLLLYAVTATAWGWLNPVFEAPDESHHVGYVNRLLRDKRLAHANDAYAMLKFLAAHSSPEGDAQVLEAGQ